MNTKRARVVCKFSTRFDAKVGEIAPNSAPLYPVPSLLYSDLPKLKKAVFDREVMSSLMNALNIHAPELCFQS